MQKISQRLYKKFYFIKQHLKLQQIVSNWEQEKESRERKKKHQRVAEKKPRQLIYVDSGIQSDQNTNEHQKIILNQIKQASLDLIQDIDLLGLYEEVTQQQVVDKKKYFKNLIRRVRQKDTNIQQKPLKISDSTGQSQENTKDLGYFIDGILQSTTNYDSCMVTKPKEQINFENSRHFLNKDQIFQKLQKQIIKGSRDNSEITLELSSEHSQHENSSYSKENEISQKNNIAMPLNPENIVFEMEEEYEQDKTQQIYNMESSSLNSPSKTLFSESAEKQEFTYEELIVARKSYQPESVLKEKNWGVTSSVQLKKYILECQNSNKKSQNERRKRRNLKEKQNTEVENQDFSTFLNLKKQQVKGNEEVIIKLEF